MTINRNTAGALLKATAFRQLFIEELGWDHCALQIAPVTVKGVAYRLEPVAEKHGFAVFVVTQTLLPDYPSRREIERQLAKSVHEHLIIFCNATKTEQVWQWVKREVGRPAACREHHYVQGQQGEALLQKLEHLVFALEDEGTLGIGVVAAAVKRALDIQRVTKRFYDRFQAEHKAFLSLIDGLDGVSRDWYASLMLNRLMFVYFIQKKGFLSGNVNYLPTKLREVQARRGKDKFQTFYRAFLLKLFHDGLGGKPPRPKEIDALIGKVPYLNGGLFDPHQLERDNPKIDIPDEAFERIFGFFDAYQWHLDDRPVRNDTEINPDVLGYIFEKYINQKQMGAYYTQEDITGYISRVTVIPLLLRRAKAECEVAFSGEASVWGLLAKDPDRYIHPAMKVGVVSTNGNLVPEIALPDYVRRGMVSPKDRMLDRRYNLGVAAPAIAMGEVGALPTETWREYIERRRQCFAVREQLAQGCIRSVEDLVALNLDLRQFMQDIVENCDSPNLLRAIWRGIVGGPQGPQGEDGRGITILDPTCGSGAFLFAALQILEVLYEACIDRMASFVEDGRRLGKLDAFPDFEAVLDNVKRHPSRGYFIYKSIILNNLFGVDIMPEAVEICKLRLFLKLVSQAETEAQLEPLPDIDFNIRAGNSLVGYATERHFDLSDSLASDKEHRARIQAETTTLARLFAEFRATQTAPDGQVTAAEKRVLQTGLDGLRLELDSYLAKDYNAGPEKKKAFTAWREKHQPFHWFAEFYAVMTEGGFDVIIGNPPYVVYPSKHVEYDLTPCGYLTLPTKNLYCFTFERCVQLAKADGPIGLIVPLTVLSSEKLPPLQTRLLKRGHLIGLPFPRRPESIFDGVEMPVAIMVSSPAPSTVLQTSRVSRFYTEERPSAIATIRLTTHSAIRDGHRIGKVGSPIGVEILRKLSGCSSAVQALCRTSGKGLVFYQEACRYWVKAMSSLPRFKRNGHAMEPPHGRVFKVESKPAGAFIACLLNSSLFYWFYSVFSDCEHINDALVKGFPVPPGWDRIDWLKLDRELATSLAANAAKKRITTKQGHTIEYDEINASRSKNTIDQIELQIADLYGLTAEEADFLVNYDIKYRMGGADEDDE